MNFFEQQDQARKKTGLLVFYFILAVVFILVAVNAVVIFAILAGDKKHAVQIQPDWIFLISAGTLALIGFGSLYKIMALGLGGGGSIAESLGGVKVSPNTSDLKERQLLNIVEEMSIASGCTVPTVYVLKNEPGLNAFAAGFKVNNAVVAVTQGCLDALNREELQGVIGHEFSHILNGDMKLNLKLMGVLHGILLIGLVGEAILRGSRRSSGSGKKDGGGILLVGLALFILGYVGVFFGNLIKAAVSRQREFLADASSVQFTRNPFGIANALKKIGGFAQGSKIQSSKAGETSHLFFGSALTSSFTQLLATHPPLTERIKRIDPAFDGKFSKNASGSVSPRPSASFSPERVEAFANLDRPLPPQPDQTPFTAILGNLVDQVGVTSPENLKHTYQLLSQMPEPLTRAAREPLGACAIVYGLLLDSDPSLRTYQREYLQSKAAEAALPELEKLSPLLDSLPEEGRLPLLDLAIPSLRNLSRDQYLVLKSNMDSLIRMDGSVNRFELLTQKLLTQNLDPFFMKAPKRVPRPLSFNSVKKQVELLLSTLARWGSPKDDKQAFAAFEKGALSLRLRGMSFMMQPASACTSEKLDEVLKILESTPPFVRRKILDACAKCIMADLQVTLEEIETFRMVAACLDCPVPPVLQT